MKKTESHAYPRGGAPPHAHILWLWGHICWWILLLSLTASEAFDYLPDFSRMPLPVHSAHTCGFEPSATKHIVIYGSLALAVQREVSARATECRGSYTSVISSTVQTEIEGQERNNFFFFFKSWMENRSTNPDLGQTPKGHLEEKVYMQRLRRAEARLVAGKA